MHAFLFRKWKQNVKGRDWYDLEWYIRKGVAMDLNHFIIRAKDSGDLAKDTLTEAELRTLMLRRIDSVNMQLVIDDISRFIPDPKKIAIWSPTYFHDLVHHLKVRT